MRQLAICLCAVVACTPAALSGASPSLSQSGKEWMIEAGHYHAKVDSNGLLKHLNVGDDCFLADPGSVPGGCYLCDGGIWGPGTSSKTTETTLSSNGDRASIHYVFATDRIDCQVENHQDSVLTFYALIHPNILKVRVNGIYHDTPASAGTASARWIGSTHALVMSGIDRIWGPWKDHQVCEIKLKPGEKRTMSLVLTSATEQDRLGVVPEMEHFDTSGKYTNPSQIPVCMIGDSITWWNHGDTWRKYLLEEIPTLAFVGTHSARLGYSHAGEGGNSIEKVMARVKQIPDCLYYHLLIGTNNNNVKDEASVPERSKKAAESIRKLVTSLLEKPSCKAVFLGSILPCHTDNPLRDKTNSATNVLLHKALTDGRLPVNRVQWIEYEKPLRNHAGWEEKIQLHPTPEGYRLLSGITAGALRKYFTAGKVNTTDTPTPNAGTGVRVHNLWDDDAGQTSVPVIAGYYTLSFDVEKIEGDAAAVTVESVNEIPGKSLHQQFAVPPDSLETRLSFEFYTREEGYSYTRDALRVKTQQCRISHILLEKKRPSGLPSEYGTGVYIDTRTPPAPGELVERAP